MSNQDPLGQMAAYQAYLQNQSGGDDPFKLSQDALMQLVISSLTSGKKGMADLGTKLTRLSSINSLLGAPTKKAYDDPYQITESVQRQLYGKDPTYSQAFDEIDKGTPISVIAKAVAGDPSTLNGEDPDAFTKVVTDYATERATNSNAEAKYNTAHPNPAPQAPSRDALLEQFTKQFAPTQANVPRVVAAAAAAAQQGNPAVRTTMPLPSSPEAADVRKRRVIEQVLARRFGNVAKPDPNMRGIFG